MIRYLFIWTAGFLLYGVFWAWFFNQQAPLSETEIRQHLTTYAELYKGSDSETQIRLRGFLAGDDSREVYTFHLVRMRAQPAALAVPAAPAALAALATLPNVPQSVFDVLSYWVEPITWRLYRRGGYPVVFGLAVSDNLSQWGIEQTDKSWTHFALVRHRSRRDLMEVINNEEVAARQEILLATIESQFSFSLAPLTMLLMLTPAAVMAWIIFALTVLVHLAVLRQDQKLPALAQQQVVVKDGTE